MTFKKWYKDIYGVDCNLNDFDVQRMKRAWDASTANNKLKKHKSILKSFVKQIADLPLDCYLHREGVKIYTDRWNKNKLTGAIPEIIYTDIVPMAKEILKKVR